MKVRVKAPEYKSILKPYTPLHTPPVFRKGIEGLEFTLTQPSPFRVERVPGANSIEVGSVVIFTVIPAFAGIQF